MEELLSPREASKILGVCVMTLRNWEKEGKLQSLRTAGGHRRFRFEDVQKCQIKKVQESGIVK
jgi:excisionase family DNA binding protein